MILLVLHLRLCPVREIIGRPSVPHARMPRSPEAEETIVKGSQKPKKMAKKPAQKTLKERRVEKRAAEKQNRP